MQLVKLCYYGKVLFGFKYLELNLYHTMASNNKVKDGAFPTGMCIFPINNFLLLVATLQRSLASNGHRLSDPQLVCPIE